MSKQSKKTATVVKNNDTKETHSLSSLKYPSYFNAIAVLSIIILGFIIYSNSYDCSFHFDDVQNISENKTIRSTSISEIWEYNHNRFLANYSFALNYHFNKLDVWGFHLVNIIIHILNALLVFWLTLLIFSTPACKGYDAAKNKLIIALIAALIFVSHPLATQSVTYIVQRLASMVTMFYLLSVALYIKARITENNQPFRYIFYAAATLAGICAMVTKENSFTLPVSIVMVELCFLQTKKLQINFSNFKLMSVIAALLIFMVWVLNKFQDVMLQPVPPTKINEFRTITPLNYLFTQFSVIVKYIQLLILPINQHLDYDFPLAESFFNISTLFSFLLLCILVWLGFYAYSKNRIIAFGIFWFFITLAIESSIVPIADLIFEHRTYLPSFGFFLIMSYGIYYLLWHRNKTIAIALCILLIGANSVATYSRNKIWIDDETLLQDDVEKSPGKSRTHYNRGLNFAEKNNYDSAIVEYSKAIAIQPKLAEASCNRGIAYQKLNNYKQAMSDYNQALQLDDKLVEGYYNRGNIYSRTGENMLALSDLNKALALKPDYYLALSERGNVYYHLKKHDSALIDFEKTLKLNPNETTVFCNRGNVYSDLGEYDKAIIDYNRYISISPDYMSYYNRANLYYKIKNYNNAIADYDNAIKLNPRFAEGYFYRGTSKFYLSNNKGACADWQESLKLGFGEGAALVARYCK